MKRMLLIQPFVENDYARSGEGTGMAERADLC
jgi:hypothetical protein